MGETGSVSSRPSGGASSRPSGPSSEKAKTAAPEAADKKATAKTRGELADSVRISADVGEAPQASGLVGALTSNFGPNKPSEAAESAAVETLREHIGERTFDLKGKLPGGFTAAGGLDKNCADTVTSQLKAAGTFDENIINVKQMEKAFIEKGIEQIPASEAMPGDVWISDKRNHTELVSEAGGEMTIGSNNIVDANGKFTDVQAISERPKDPDSGVYYDLTPG